VPPVLDLLPPMSRIKAVEEPITLELDGDPLPAREGEPIAAALIGADQLLFARSPKYHRPRGPFCLSGACSQCLMSVDGVPNVPTCRVPARPGMRLQRQNALPDARLDLLRASDFFFRTWFNHHEFLTSVPLAQGVLMRVARQLSGLGVLPEKPGPTRPPAALEHHDTLVVGAGPSGLAAAAELERRGLPYTLLEREALAGGRLLTDPGEVAPAWAPPAERLRLGALVVGLFADDGPPFLAVIDGDRLHLLFYRRLLLAVGGHPQLPTFPNNDLPGVMAGRAVSRLIRQSGVLPGHRVACVGEPGEAGRLAALLASVGAAPLAVGAEVLRAHGLRQVEAVTVSDAQGTRRLACDVIALCGPHAPSFELARAAGVGVVWDGASHLFRVDADARGATSVPGVFVAGELRGPASAAQAAEQGLAAAQALAERGGAP
jgi:sarcosine oxidase, subunit alpha